MYLSIILFAFFVFCISSMFGRFIRKKSRFTFNVFFIILSILLFITAFFLGEYSNIFLMSALYVFLFFFIVANGYLTSSARDCLQKVIQVLYNRLLHKAVVFQWNIITRVSPQWIRPSLFVVSCDHDTAIGFALFFTLYSLVCLGFSSVTLVLFTIKHWLFPDAEIKSLYSKACKLPLLNRIFLLIFTLTFAIPNRVWVKSSSSRFWLLKVTLLFFLLVFAHILPILYAIVGYLVCLTGESYVFARVYETYSWFKQLTNRYLFAGGKEFAAQYFFYFWGNMWRGAVNTAKQGVITTFPYVVYRYKRSDEVEIKREKTANEYNSLEGTDKLHPLEQRALKKSIAQEVQAEDCPVLNAEDACMRQIKVAAKFVKASAEKFME